eukprot:902319-Ditylum_brightwellii.AAC.1
MEKLAELGWYADDSAKAAFFEAIQEWFKELCQIGPPLGYFPEPDKSILVTALQNLELAKNYFKVETFKIKTEKVLEWVESVQKFLPMVQQNPQAVHTDICWSLQHGWAYLQRVIEVDPEKHTVLDSIIQSELIPALFDADDVPAEFDQIFALPVKEAGIGILSPLAESGMNWATSVASTKHLGAVGRKKRKSDRYENIFSEVCTHLSLDLVLGLEERGKEGGDWLNMLPHYKNNNVLCKGEFCDGLLL